MASTLSDPKTARVALMSIGRAIRDLSKPTSKIEEFNEYGSMIHDIYPTGSCPPDMRGQPPRFWPAVIAVTEALIGSAFAVAQAHLVACPKNTSTARNVNHAANYWKHRDDWGPPWGNGQGAPHPPTLAGITALGITPPIAPGQMKMLAERVLAIPGDPTVPPFDVETLWLAIA